MRMNHFALGALAALTLGGPSEAMAVPSFGARHAEEEIYVREMRKLAADPVPLTRQIRRARQAEKGVLLRERKGTLRYASGLSR